MIKKILKISTFLFLSLFIILLSMPYLFKDKLTDLVKSEMNKAVNARINFQDINISLFKNFPKINVSVTKIDLTGKQQFEGVSLLFAENFDLNFNLWSVIKGDNPLIIKEIALKNATINAVVLQDTSANYQIMIPDKNAATKEPSNLKLELEKYSLENTNITYQNKVNGVEAQLTGLNHSGKGSLESSIYNFVTKTIVDELNVTYGGVQYLKKVKGEAEVTVSADIPKMKFTLQENSIKLNNLLAQMTGFVQIMGAAYNIDLAIKTPNNEFKNFLSIIPSAYVQNFKQVKANGTFTFSGVFKGIYDSAKPIYPSFSFDLAIPKADLKYPNLPLGISDISVISNVTFPGGNNLDFLQIDVSKFKIKVGSNPFEGKFRLKTPMSDPDLDAQAKGVLNLKELGQSFPLEGVQSLSGILNADIDIRATMSQITKKQYEKIAMRGDLILSDMTYKTKDKPLILVTNMAMNFTPNKVLLRNFQGKLGKSDIQCSGKIDNLLAYFSPKNTMTGDLLLRSNFFDANEWVSAEPAKNEVKPSIGKAETVADQPFNRFQFLIDGAIQQINYDKYVLKNAVLKGDFAPNKIVVSNFKSNIGNSDISMSGTLNNVYNYLFDKGILSGKINMSSSNLDMNQFMDKNVTKNTENKNTPPAGIIPVPKNIDIQIEATVDKLKYTNMDLQNMKGTLLVKEEAVKMQGFKANTLGGSVGMNGSYTSKNTTKTGFDMDIDLQKISFQNAFTTFNVVQKLAPIAQFIDGKFNTTMKFNGLMGQDMMPDLSTLTASGFLQTISGLIKNFKPLEEVGSKLNVTQLKNLELRDTKNYFEIANGAVILKEFDYQMKDVGLKIGGTHSLTNEMNYSIKAKIPRKLIGDNKVGAAATSGLELLSKESQKLGINLSVGEFINVLFNIGGSMGNPKVTMKLLGTEGKSATEQVTETGKAIVTKAVDSIKTRINQQVEKTKEQAAKAVDSVKTVVTQKVDEAKEKAKQQADDAKKKMEEEARKKIDDAKKKLNDLNPFKRGGNR